MKSAFPRSLVMPFLAAGIAVAAPAAADPVKDQIELGLEYYLEGEYGSAITELEFAINDLRKLVSGRLSGTFPDAPAGWTATEPTMAGGGEGGGAILSALGGGAMIERTYTQNRGKGRLTATVMIDNPMIQGFGALLNNPALLASQPNVERLRVGRETGMIKWEAARGDAEATLLLDGRILLRVEGSNLEGPEIAADLLKEWDLDALRAEAAR